MKKGRTLLLASALTHPGHHFQERNRTIAPYHAEGGDFLDGEYLLELAVVAVILGQAVDVERLRVQRGERDVARVQPVAGDVVRGADEAAVEQVLRLGGGVARQVLDQPVALALACGEIILLNDTG